MKVKVRAVYAHDDVPAGAEFWTDETPRVRGVIARGALEVVERERKRKIKAEEADDGAAGAGLGEPEA